MVSLQNRHFEQPQEKLLDLGKISKIYPVIERGLMEPRPEGYSLQLMNIFLFERDLSPSSGQRIGVMVPSWWRERKKRKLGARLKLYHVQSESKPALRTVWSEYYCRI